LMIYIKKAPVRSSMRFDLKAIYKTGVRLLLSKTAVQL